MMVIAKSTPNFGSKDIIVLASNWDEMGIVVVVVVVAAVVAAAVAVVIVVVVVEVSASTDRNAAEEMYPVSVDCNISPDSIKYCVLMGDEHFEEVETNQLDAVHGFVGVDN